MEHIRPQQGSNWVECDDEGKVYQLGNMILLKQTSNSKVSNKSLVEKKKVYKQVGVCDVAKPDVYSINSEEEWDIAISDRSLDISTKLISILDADEFPY